MIRNLMLAAIILLAANFARAEPRLSRSSLDMDVCSVERLIPNELKGSAVRWSSTDQKVAQVYQNGYVVALHPGKAMIKALAETGGAEAMCVVTVIEPDEPLVDPATLQQYDDNRVFHVNGGKCVGSELNGQRAVGEEERRNTKSNRVINPDPLTPDAPLEWEVEEGTEVFDGAGVPMGTVAPKLKVGDRKVPTTKFNFGMSKILNGRMCLYAFSVPIKPGKEIAKLVDPREIEDGAVGTSAWLPLDRVVQKESLLERIGLGKTKLPRLPLEETRYRITGGNPRQYVTEFGEMSIVKDIHAGPVPSHYLKRPSGTVNVVYSVPGFGLGGQGLDSFLASDELIFRPAKGAKVFVQPTWFPPKHPKAGQASPMTMTFVYGGVEAKGRQPVYGWVAKEALKPAK